MSAALAALQDLLDARSVWHAGRHVHADMHVESTGHAALDDLLPSGGWPRGALSEVLIPHDGVGELALLLPALSNVARRGGRIVLVAPPYIAYAPAWRQHGMAMSALTVLEADPRDALWAMEQCLRSGSCDIVLGWSQTGDAQLLRRLQVAAHSGGSIGVVLRDAKHAANPSPAALRLQHTRAGWRVRKCRGAAVPQQAFALAH